MAVKYETYFPNICWTLSGTVVATNFIRSQFDYGVRQRRALRGNDNYSVRIVLSNQTDMDQWLLFWSDLNYGNDIFITDQIIDGDTSVDKNVRFTSGYSNRDIGNGLQEITVPVEHLQT